MPDGKKTWYCNNSEVDDKWQDMFISEFLPFIEKEYRIRTKRNFRAIAGLSMGGYGALNISMKNSELFQSCVALSAAVFTDEEIADMGNERYSRYFRNIYGKGLKGEARITRPWNENNPLYMLDIIPYEKLEEIRLYIDCGDNDFMYLGNTMLHIKLRKMKIKHEYRVRDGGHSWNYWRTGLPEGIEFISKTFHY